MGGGGRGENLGINRFRHVSVLGLFLGLISLCAWDGHFTTSKNYAKQLLFANKQIFFQRKTVLDKKYNVL